MREEGDVLDTVAALASVGGDREFLRELIGIFRAASQTLLREIQEALAGGDLEEVRNGAWLVRMAAQSISATRVYAAATVLETRAQYWQLDEAQLAACELQDEVDRLKPALAAFGDGVNHSQS
jgi:HPt (histidine-containing phosphotransfer) domain-containing protein